MTGIDDRWNRYWWQYRYSTFWYQRQIFMTGIWHLVSSPSVHHTYLISIDTSSLIWEKIWEKDMRKNEGLIKEEKGGVKDRLELLVPQAELGLAFSSNIPFSRVSHSSPKTSLLIVRPAMVTAFVSPVARSLVQDGQMAAWKMKGKNSGTLVSLTHYVGTSDASMEWERRWESRNEVKVRTNKEKALPNETKKLERSKLNGREGKLCLLSQGRLERKRQSGGCVYGDK